MGFWDKIKKLFNKRKIFLISDTHFDHYNIIKYCNRPFKNVNEMNNVIVNNWNKTVRKKDIIYFLGDVCFGRGHRSIDYWFSKLNGKIFFIRGNHDKGKVTKAKEIRGKYFLEYKGYKFILMHDPYRPKDYDGWIIHGDKHNNDLVNYPFINGERKSINVSAEVVNYRPINLDLILSLNLDSIKSMDYSSTMFLNHHFNLLIFSLLFSIIIGMVSGVIPAYRTSKLSPVYALRYE